MSDDRQSFEELQAHFGPDGPVEGAKRWIVAAIHDRDWRRAWALMDDNHRLARAQAWIYNNRSAMDIAAHDRDELAATFAENPPPALPLWGEFATLEVEAFTEAWPDGFDLNEWGAGSRPRPVDLEHELIVFVHRSGVHEKEVIGYDEADDPIEAEIFTSPTAVPDARLFLMHHMAGGWRVAGFGDQAPTPGWPPTF